MATEFFVIMLKRADGKVEADMHKCSKVFHTTQGSADAALANFLVADPEIARHYHVVRLLAMTAEEYIGMTV